MNEKRLKMKIKFQNSIKEYLNVQGKPRKKHFKEVFASTEDDIIIVKTVYGEFTKHFWQTSKFKECNLHQSSKNILKL